VHQGGRHARRRGGRENGSCCSQHGHAHSRGRRRQRARRSPTQCWPGRTGRGRCRRRRAWWGDSRVGAHLGRGGRYPRRCYHARGRNRRGQPRRSPLSRPRPRPRPPGGRGDHRGPARCGGRNQSGRPGQGARCPGWGRAARGERARRPARTARPPTRTGGAGGGDTGPRPRRTRGACRGRGRGRRRDGRRLGGRGDAPRAHRRARAPGAPAESGACAGTARGWGRRAWSRTRETGGVCDRPGTPRTATAGGRRGIRCPARSAPASSAPATTTAAT